MIITEEEKSFNSIKENKSVLDEFYSEINREQSQQKKSKLVAQFFKKRVDTFKKAGFIGSLIYNLRLVHFKLFPGEYYDRKLEYDKSLYACDRPKTYEYRGRIAVYSAIFGDYDEIQQPEYKSPYCDYYIFSDREIPENSVWKKPNADIESLTGKMDGYHKSKFCKFFPNLLFPEYRYSIWLDGNIKVFGDPYPLIEALNDSVKISMFDHPQRFHITKEANIAVFLGKADRKSIDKQINKYLQEGYPDDFGMRECSVIIREHNDKEIIHLMEDWWEQVNAYTMRDQISLPYVLWKNGKEIDYIYALGKNWRHCPLFGDKKHLK